MRKCNSTCFHSMRSITTKCGILIDFLWFLFEYINLTPELIALRIILIKQSIMLHRILHFIVSCFQSDNMRHSVNENPSMKIIFISLLSSLHVSFGDFNCYEITEDRKKKQAKEREK